MSLVQNSEWPKSTGRQGKQRWFAAAGMLGAILASACCLGPLVLLTLGISGAWIANLVALEPFKPYFAMLALGFIGAGFHQVYVRKPVVCEPGSYCARPASARITRIFLWSGLVLVLAALSIGWWAPLFY